jgi:hypothetical protein
VHQARDGDPCQSTIGWPEGSACRTPIVRRPSDDALILRAVTWSSEQAAHKEACYGWRMVDKSPDSRPAVRLRLELERDRQQGFSFDAVFADEVDWALDAAFHLSGNDVESWRVAFAATADAWRAAYDRTEPSSVFSLADDLLAA